MAVSNFKDKHYDLLTNLQDAGLSTEMQEPFLKSIQDGQVDQSKNILNTHRSRLLTEIHAEQDKLYCTDVLLRKLKQK
jgi:hypothetical protein